MKTPLSSAAKPFRILCVEAYPGFRGAQRSLAALLGGLRGMSANPAPLVSVLCLTSGQAATSRAVEGYRATGVTVHSLTPPSPLQAYGGALRSASPQGLWRLVCALPLWCFWTLRVRRWLARQSPDLVHCNQARGVLLVAMAARSLGLPVVWHQRGMLDLPDVLVRLTGLLSTHILCVSEAVRRSFPARLRERADVVHNGIDRPLELPDKAGLRRQLGIDNELARRRLPKENTLLLITASSWLPYKGLHHVVEALGHLEVKQPGLRPLWLLLGDDDGHPGKHAYGLGLRRRLDDLGWTDHVWWAGWQPQSLQWLAAADLCLLPTVAQESWTDAQGKVRDIRCSEGFPRTVLEAMTVGTAVVASDVAAVSEQVVHGESGWIVPPGDAMAMADAVRRLGSDTQLRQGLTLAAHRRVERFSVETMCERTLAFWQKCLAPHPASKEEAHG